MTGFTITISQQKGGAGKTTLAAQLATALIAGGFKVATLDVDPQGSLTLWATARMARLGNKNKLTHHQVQGFRLKKEVDRAREEMDYVIIDAPPHAESEAAIAIRNADLVLIPMQPSPMDLWASRPTIQLAQSEKIEARIVLNRTDPRTKLNASIMDKLQELDVQCCAQTLGNRVAFAASMLDGLGVVETEKNGTAAKEITALMLEIQKLQNKTKRKAA